MLSATISQTGNFCFSFSVYGIFLACNNYYIFVHFILLFLFLEPWVFAKIHVSFSTLHLKTQFLSINTFLFCIVLHDFNDYVLLFYFPGKLTFAVCIVVFKYFHAVLIFSVAFFTSISLYAF